MTNTLTKTADAIIKAWDDFDSTNHITLENLTSKAAANAILNGAEVMALIEALRSSQKAIEELMEQGSPTAYWADIENANLKALDTIKKLKSEVAK